MTPVCELDEAKHKLNVAEHGVDFTAAEGLDRDSAVLDIDYREDYGELREVALGFIGIRLFVLVFTRRGEQVRIVSLRKAHNLDLKKYAEEVRR